nr:MAG TPA: hypothetical protein [Caudoviricetes sp.]
MARFGIAFFSRKPTPARSIRCNNLYLLQRLVLRRFRAVFAVQPCRRRSPCQGF